MGKSGVRSFILKINQLVESERDFEEFYQEFQPAFQTKFGENIQIKMQNRRAIFYLHYDDLEEIRIDFMEKKKEKLVKIDSWAYYLPAGWICYNINWKTSKTQQISSYVEKMELALKAISPKQDTTKLRANSTHSGDVDSNVNEQSRLSSSSDGFSENQQGNFARMLNRKA